jgi:hypothetical protein
MNTETSTEFSSDALTPAEMEYFSSKGEKTEGLVPAESTPAPTPTEAPNADPAPVDGEVPAEDDDGAFYIDENGKARSVITGKFVPHQALHKERERRKSTEAELNTYRERMARAEERLAVLNEVLTQPAQANAAQASQPEEEPDPSKDIFAAFEYERQKRRELEARIAERDQQSQSERQLSQLQNAYAQDAQRFMAEKPDFKEAYSYIANSRARELSALGYSQDQIRQQLTHEETNIVAQAFQQRRSPSAVLYEQAIARGYTPKQAQAIAVQSNAAQKLETIAKAQTTQKSLSGAGGTAGEGLTLEALANMSEEEFAATAAKIGKSKLKALMGG